MKIVLLRCCAKDERPLPPPQWGRHHQHPYKWRIESVNHHCHRYSEVVVVVMSPPLPKKASMMVGAMMNWMNSEQQNPFCFPNISRNLTRTLTLLCLPFARRRRRKKVVVALAGMYYHDDSRRSNGTRQLRHC